MISRRSRQFFFLSIEKVHGILGGLQTGCKTRGINRTRHPMRGVPAVAQRNQRHLWSAGTQVQSPAWQSGLRIPHCHSCGIGHSCGSDLIPGPGTPPAVGWPKKRRRRRKKKKKPMRGDVSNTFGLFPIAALTNSVAEISTHLFSYNSGV